MNQWIERAVREATEERQRILDGIQTELADVARIDAAILALTGQAPPSPLAVELGADYTPPAPEPAEPPPASAPEPKRPARPARPPAPPRPAPSLTAEGQATPAMIEAALREATGPQSTREVLAAIQQQHPEVVGLGNALAESVEAGRIERLDGRAPDGFPLLALGSGTTGAPPAPKPERPKRTPPPVSSDRQAKARERWESIRDYLAQHGPTPRKVIAEVLGIPKGSWGSAGSAGTLLHALASEYGIRSELTEDGGSRISYLLLPDQVIGQSSGQGSQNGQGQSEQAETAVAEGELLALMPALKQTKNVPPRAQEREAAAKQLEVWNTIRAYGKPFTILDLLATGLEQDLKRVQSYLRAFKDVGYLRPTGERRRNVKRDGHGKPPDVLRVSASAPPGGVQKSSPKVAEAEPPPRPTDGAADTTAPQKDASQLSLEIVRDCSREIGGEFSPAQMVALIERKYERMRVPFQTVEAYLKTLAQRGTLADISPTPDMPLYEYTKPTGPGKAAELDAQRRGETTGSPIARGGPVPGSGKPGSAGSGKVDRLLRAVERAGGSWRRSGSGHFLITLADNRRATIAATPSETSHRSDIMKLRKLGVAV